MKRLLSFSLILGAAVALGWFLVQAFEEGPAHADGGLGQGGGGAPDPQLPDTGMTQCYSEAAGEIDCVATGPCGGQDAFYDTGCGHGVRFVVNDGETPADLTDDTVTDLCTGLEWQRDRPEQNGEEGFTISICFICRDDAQPANVVECGSPEEVTRERARCSCPGTTRDPAICGECRIGDEITWCEALAYCNDLVLGGKDDWRLPNIRELLSIADYGLGTGITNPAIDRTFFEVSPDDFKYNSRQYWSSTQHEDEVGKAWVVNFSHGSVNRTPVDRWHFVRAVRGGTGAGGGATGQGGDGAERGGGAGPPGCVDDNGNINGDVDRDLSDAISLLAWLFQGGAEPVPFCTAGPKADGCAAENGNINGDVDRDLSDAISLLAWLFQGGAEPVPPCPTGEPENCTSGMDEDGDGATDCADPDCFLDANCLPTPSPLPATGQTKCYDELGGEMACAATGPCGGQDGFYAAGCPNDASRFVDNDGGTPDMPGMPDDDTVTDTCTGLMWQRDQSDVTGDGMIITSDPQSPENEDAATWCLALNHCQVTLNNRAFGGHTDWRLPNVLELQSLVDYSRATAFPLPAMDPKFDGIAGAFWSSTNNPDSGAHAFYIDFNLGATAHVAISPGAGLDRKKSVRAVRDAP